MSINIQELRIGNYVMAGDTLNPRKVESIFSGLRRARLRSDRGDSSTFSEDEMIPIEITEEWLINLGYRQHGHTGYWYHDKCRFPVFKPTDARTCLMNDLDFFDN